MIDYQRWQIGLREISRQFISCMTSMAEYFHARSRIRQKVVYFLSALFCATYAVVVLVGAKVWILPANKTIGGHLERKRCKLDHCDDRQTGPQSHRTTDVCQQRRQLNRADFDDLNDLRLAEVDVDASQVVPHPVAHCVIAEVGNKPCNTCRPQSFFTLQIFDVDCTHC